MLLSIIIPTYKRKKILLETLQSLITHKDFDNNNIEIIVVNDDKENDLSDVKDVYKNVIILNNIKKGPASARNLGASIAKGKILLFNDDDVLPSENYFKRHINVQNKFEKIICSAYRIYPESIIKKAEKYPFGRYKIFFEYKVFADGKFEKIEDEIYKVDGIPSYSMSIKKKYFEELNGFNEKFLYPGCEDAEFSYVASKKGYLLVLDKKNICYHNEMDNFTLERWLWRQEIGIKTCVIICSLHPEGKNHSEWLYNSPFKLSDPLNVKLIKIKKYILHLSLVHKFLLFFTKILEKIKAPDFILFKLYNSLWIGRIKQSFDDEYKKVFKNK